MNDRSERDIEHDRRVDLAGLAEAAERLDGLAEMADVMDDGQGADRLREAAAAARLQAMNLIDQAPTDD